MLRFYVEVARTAYRRQLIYRWANLAGLCTNVFFCVILSSVLIALYHARPAVGGYNLRDALSYSWATQAMIMTVVPFGWITRLHGGSEVAEQKAVDDPFRFAGRSQFSPRPFLHL